MGLLRQLELAHPSDEVEQFLHFFRDLAWGAEPLIIALGGEKYAEAAGGLARLAHNVAWAAGRLGQEELGRFCELIEELMSRLAGPAGEGFIDWLLLAGEQCEAYYQAYENDAASLGPLNPALLQLPDPEE